jgi:hypothetical protein
MPEDHDSTTGPCPNAVQESGEATTHEIEDSTADDGSDVSAVHVVPPSCSAKPVPVLTITPTATQETGAKHETEDSRVPGTDDATVAVQTPACSTSISASPRSVAPTVAHRAAIVHEIDASESEVTPAGSASTVAVHAPPARAVTKAKGPGPVAAWAVPDASQTRALMHDTPLSDAVDAPAGSRPTRGVQVPSAKVSTSAWSTVEPPEATPYEPTATQVVAVGQLTPDNEASTAPVGSGSSPCNQVPLSRLATKAPLAPVVPGRSADPTATHLVAESQLTPAMVA